MQSQWKLNRALLATFVVTMVAGIVYHLDLFGHVAYALERGKLQADLEHLRQIDADDVATLEQLSHAFSVIAEAVKPSVVHIQARSSNREINRELQRLFGEKVQPFPKMGTGSGVIIDEDGYVITNNHVVSEAEEIRVILSDGRRFEAEIIGTDAKTDLAVIRIGANRLHAGRLGNSDRVKVGHLVLAIGSPFRLGHSVSHGIISAIGRSDVNVDIDYQNWLQTDAPINPGNSGGPLINTRGEVIGITTAIATESGGHQGVGFAIPSNMVKFVADKLRSGKKLVRGYLGIGIRPVDPQVASTFGLDQTRGVLVDAIGRRTPASRAGLKPEDIILAMDGRVVQTREHLQEMIAATEPDTKVQMTVWRERREIRLEVTVGAQADGFSTRGTIRDLNRRTRPDDRPPIEEEEDFAEAAKGGENRRRFRELGFEAATVSPELAKELGLEEHLQNGALITYVSPAGEAYAANLRRGQVITRANGRRIHNVRELAQVLTKDAVATGVRLGIQWRGEGLFTVLQLR